MLNSMLSCPHLYRESLNSYCRGICFVKSCIKIEYIIEPGYNDIG